jgi:hypothetical protein
MAKNRSKTVNIEQPPNEGRGKSPRIINSNGREKRKRVLDLTPDASAKAGAPIAEAPVSENGKKEGLTITRFFLAARGTIK